jgi:hypothetical protein
VLQRKIIDSKKMSRRSQKSLLKSLEKERAVAEASHEPDNFEIVVQKFYVNYNNWHQDYRNNPLPEQVVVRMDLQLEVIKRALEQPVNEERRNKIIKQIEALSFMYASVASLLNWPDDKINF